MSEPSEKNLDKMWKYAKGFAEKSGTVFHPNPAVTESVVKGLAANTDELGKPLCPCNFYQDKKAEAKLRRWICACDEITEYLPEDHEGRQCYGIITDPTPDKGRALRHKAPTSAQPAQAASPTEDVPFIPQSEH